MAKKRSRKKKSKSPVQIAGIDVGATSIRMKVAELHDDGSITTIEELVHPVAIGADTFRFGFVRSDTLRAACKVMKNFSRTLKQYGVTQYRAMATSAIREATNKEIVIDRIRHESGIELQVLDAVEEGRFTWQTLVPGLKQYLSDAERYTMLLDLGGGSTEIMVLKGENIVFVGTRRLGTARLFHSVEDKSDSHAMLEPTVNNIVNSTLNLYRDFPISQCIVINPLLSRALQNEAGISKFDRGIVLPVATVKRLMPETTGISHQDLAKRFSVSFTDAELLEPSLLILERFASSIKIDEVIITGIDLLAGIMGEIVMANAGIEPINAFRNQILSSAVGVGERYDYDSKHATHVTELCRQLFDNGLQKFLDLTGEDRLILELAGILHDIGMFICERAHHKHSAYLVNWSDIVGISESDNLLIAQVVRYHRKALPGSNHPEFMALTRPQRLRVRKLASILRIADALERSHTQSIRSLKVRVGKDELRIAANARSDLSIERSALASKSDLFTQVTGLNVSLSRDFK